MLLRLMCYFCFVNQTKKIYKMSQNPLATPRMGFFEAIKTCFNKFFTFHGRARRSEFWWWCLFVTIMNLIFIHQKVLSEIVYVILFFPSLSVAVRRLKDIGRSPAIIILVCVLNIFAFIVMTLGLAWGVIDLNTFSALVMFIGIGILFIAFIVHLYILILFVRDSQKGANIFGESPKYPSSSSKEEEPQLLT